MEWKDGVLHIFGREYGPEVRRIKDLAPVLLDPEDSEEPAYYMYRGVCAEEDKGKFKDVRYDVTIIPPRTIGREYVKTFGHYHPVAEQGLSYPEVYEVLEGEAIYLLQKRDASEFIAVKAEKGDVVIIPPNYGHVTINRADTLLIMANLVSSKFKSEYDDVRKQRGFVYYLTKEGWMKNDRYQNDPEIKLAAPVTTFSNIYSLYVEYPKFFDWLNRPSKLDWELDKYFSIRTP